MTSARGIGFDYRPSATLTTLVATVLLLATAAPFFTSLPWYLRPVLAAIVAGYGFRRLGAFREPPVVAVSLSQAGLWTITLRTGRTVPAELRHARVFSGAVFLHLGWRKGAVQLALLPDNVPPDDLRLLRARIRSHGI
ncbi:hypothetical protein HBF26_13725 [Luteibacter jiangsuensis]|uniref:Toxin CptA n=1 Tax=Luteibacter jiangsuensis TaxID=637577 RepID=A0ABX0Q7P2_9GAMM|nr:hypothetical protein [Luteibacter jiangsuensis]NID05954.1 hypothetical protein [Luteibacter jiangsuensis]